MKTVKSTKLRNGLFFVAATLMLGSCGNSQQSLQTSASVDLNHHNHDHEHVEPTVSVLKQQDRGQVVQLSEMGKTASLHINFANTEHFRVRVADMNNLAYIKVEVSGQNITEVIRHQGDEFLPFQNNLQVTISGIPIKKNALRVVKLTGYDASHQPLVAFKTGGYYYSQTGQSQRSLELTRSNSLLVDSLWTMLKQNPELINTDYISGLKALFDNITGFNSETNTFINDPSLFDPEKIYTTIASAAPELPTPIMLDSVETRKTTHEATLSIQIPGGAQQLLNERIKIVVDDPTSGFVFLMAGTVQGKILTIKKLNQGTWMLRAYNQAGEQIAETPVIVDENGATVQDSPLLLPGVKTSEILTPIENESELTLKPSFFDSNVLIQDVGLKNCELSNGQTSSCAVFVIKYPASKLANRTFCPATLNDIGGLWSWDGINPGIYRLNRSFFEMLSGQGYTLYDENENIRVVDVRLDRPPDDVNTCLAASVDNDVELTVTIPVHPQMAAEPSELGTVAKVGLALDGAPIFADAPSVLDTGHLPALDECGGHVDPGGWYHWHATASDIITPLTQASITSDCELQQSKSQLFGYAFDGYPMYGSTDENNSTPSDLDQCNGHEGATAEYPDGIYHYHSGETFPNLPKCLKGAFAVDNFSTTALSGIGSVGGGPGGPGGDGPPPSGGPSASPTPNN